MSTRTMYEGRQAAPLARLARRFAFNLLALLRPLVFAASGLLLAIGILGLLASVIVAHGNPPLRFAIPALIIVAGLLALERLYDRILGWLASDASV